MRKIILIVLLVIVVFVLGILFKDILSFITGSVVLNQDDKGIGEKKVETFTTAVCNNDKECVDVLVTCLNGNVSKMELASNLTKFSDSWEDKREFESLCY